MKLHSSRSHFEDVRDVKRGTKPAALVEKEAAVYGEGLGLIAEPVPEGTFETLKDRLAYVVYRPEDPEAANKILDVFTRFPIGSRGKEWHSELGRALGYPESDIEYFLNEFIEGRKDAEVRS